MILVSLTYACRLQLKIGNLLQDVCKRMADYLDGDLEAAVSLPHHMMDLEFELELEEDSEWMDQTLGNKATVEDEERWRNVIAAMLQKGTMPKYVCADKKFLGGKQFQRAKELLMAAMAGKETLCLVVFFIFLPLTCLTYAWSSLAPSQRRFPTSLR